MMAGRIGAETALAELSAWSSSDDDRDAITRTFVFDDFKTAWAFMNGVALKAEQMDHHPEWYNVYNRVVVTLTTHDVDGVTRKDTGLAAYMDALAGKLV